MQSSNTTKKFNVGLIGVNGYTGMELLRLLCNHKAFNLTVVSSRSEKDQKLAKIYPFLEKHPYGDLMITDPSSAEIAKKCQLVFLAVPHGVAMELAPDLLAQNIKVIDLSADFRINDVDTFQTWYKSEHKAPELLPKAVYGLVELYADKIKDAKLVANPGCYPSASILALMPALKHKLIQKEAIIIDAKSGVSGAGRKAVIGSLFCEAYDSFKPYSLVNHRHTPEIEQELAKILGQELIVSFNPHLVPMNRGILATIYTKLESKLSLEEIHKIYCQEYSQEPFVRVLDLGKLPETHNVKGTMFCDIGLSYDPRTKQLIICSAIDNLCRGASGQALANANLVSGLPMTYALENMPMIL